MLTVIPAIVSDDNSFDIVGPDATLLASTCGNVTAGSTTTGLSQATLGASTAVGNNQPGQMRVVDLAPYVDNAWGDSYTIVRVVNSASQFFGTVNAIA